MLLLKALLIGLVLWFIIIRSTKPNAFKPTKQRYRIYYRWDDDAYFRPMNQEAWNYKNSFHQLRDLTWKNIADQTKPDLFQAYNFLKK